MNSGGFPVQGITGYARYCENGFMGLRELNRQKSTHATPARHSCRASRMPLSGPPPPEAEKGGWVASFGPSSIYACCGPLENHPASKLLHRQLANRPSFCGKKNHVAEHDRVLDLALLPGRHPIDHRDGVA